MTELAGWALWRRLARWGELDTSLHWALLFQLYLHLHTPLSEVTRHGHKSIALPSYKRREGMSLSVMSIPQTFRIFEERSSLPPSFLLALPKTRVKWRLSNASRQSRQINFRGWTFLGVDRPPWIPVNFQNFALSTQPEWRVSSGDFLPTSFPGFSPTRPTKRARERPWKTLVTWLQN